MGICAGFVDSGRSSKFIIDNTIKTSLQESGLSHGSINLTFWSQYAIPVLLKAINYSLSQSKKSNSHKKWTYSANSFQKLLPYRLSQTHLRTIPKAIWPHRFQKSTNHYSLRIDIYLKSSHFKNRTKLRAWIPFWWTLKIETTTPWEDEMVMRTTILKPWTRTSTWLPVTSKKSIHKLYRKSMITFLKLTEHWIQSSKKKCLRNTESYSCWRNDWKPEASNDDCSSWRSSSSGRLNGSESWKNQAVM